MKTEVLRIRGLSARRQVGCDLKQIYMNLYEGEVLGLVGFHDAGKSFLFDCIMGDYAADAGNLYLYEEAKAAVQWTRSDKIFRIKNQPALVPTQSVMENVFVIRKPKRRKIVVPWKAIRKEASNVMQEFSIDIDPESVVSQLSLVERHIIEILKIYMSGGKLILIDDIMMPYTAGDYELLYQVIKRFQEQGISFIICGCQMEKLQRLTDRCLFMVNGSIVKMVDNIRRKQLDEIKVLMGGNYKQSKKIPESMMKETKESRVIFEVRDIRIASGESLNFQIKEGEIVVAVDFFHQWVPQLITVIAGKQSYSGSVLVEEKVVKKRSKKVYISDFLESNYMINSLSLRDNLCFAVFNKISTLGILHPGKAKVIERIFKEQYQISDEKYLFEWGSLSFAEKMAVYMERIKLQKWKVMFCTNIENVMSYELEAMISGQLRAMVRGRRAICICASSFEKYRDLADSFLFLEDGKEIKKYTYTQLCEYFQI